MTRTASSFLTKPVLFILAGLAITLATTGVTVVSLYQMRSDAFAQARDAEQNLVRSLEDQTARNLDH